MKDHTKNELQKGLLELLCRSRVLSLASVDLAKVPEASLTPYLYQDDALWIFVSHLSSHTQNLLHDSKASVLIASSQQAKPFAIERLSLQCLATKATDNIALVLDAMTQKFGDILMVLRGLPDFELFELRPIQGRYIKGFGQSYLVDWSTMTLQHVNPEL